jgi:hypothetical protein
MVLMTSLLIGPSIDVSAQQEGEASPSVRQVSRARVGDHGIVRGRVQAVHAPRLFTVEDRLGPGRDVLVVAPDARATPAVGATVEAHGVMRRLEDSDFEETPGWRDIDEQTRARLSGRPILVAISLMSASTGQTPQRDAESPAGEPARRRAARPGEQVPATVRPATLADQISDLAGYRVRVPYARVVGVFEPRAFLIDTSSLVLPTIGNRNRVLVFVEGGSLRVPAESLVASTVTVEGIARTLLGMQVTGEVPWPARLDRETVERLEIRAAILATSVHTADGIELTDRPSTTTAASSTTASSRGDRGGVARHRRPSGSESRR